MTKEKSKVSIFSRNYRALCDGWVHLRDSNFLVGENSTGKTSLLNAIKIHDSVEFSVQFEVDQIFPRMATASDFISRSRGGREVSLGFLKRVRGRPTISDAEDGIDTSKFGGDVPVARIVTFRAKKSDILPIRCTICIGEIAYSVERRGNSYFFRLDSRDSFYDEDSISELHFGKWRGWEKLDLDGEMFSFSDAYRFAIFERLRKANISDRKRMSVLQFVGSDRPLQTRSFGPIRSESPRFFYGQKKLFDAKGGHFPFILRSEADDVVSSIDKFGIESGLFDHVMVKSIRSENSGRPFSVKFVKGGAEYFIDELGYGVGQVLPIITDMIYMSGSECTYLIQQPEVHLHPKAQAAFGELVFRMEQQGISFIIETHSDFILDRYRRVKSKVSSGCSSQVVFFEKDAIHEIPILDDGQICSSAPDGYRSFFLAEELSKFEAML